MTGPFLGTESSLLVIVRVVGVVILQRGWKFFLISANIVWQLHMSLLSHEGINPWLG